MRALSGRPPRVRQSSRSLLDAVFRLRVAHSLPLHVRWGIQGATFEWHDLVYDVAWASTARQAGRAAWVGREEGVLEFVKRSELQGICILGLR